MKRQFAILVGMFLLVSGLSWAEAGQPRSLPGGHQQLLPNPVATGGEDARTYVLVPFETARFDRGRIVATWSDDYMVASVCIAADWEFVSDYVPGMAIPLAVEAGKLRYDFVGRFVDRRTGDEFLATTPLLDRDGIESAVSTGRSVGVVELAPPPDADGTVDPVPATCSVTDRAAACTASVTCDGDSGTCTSCGDVDTACCNATKTTTTTTPSGETTTTVVKITKIQEC